LVYNQLISMSRGNGTMLALEDGQANSGSLSKSKSKDSNALALVAASSSSDNINRTKAGGHTVKSTYVDYRLSAIEGAAQKAGKASFRGTGR
jgi:hypothetical protein